VVPGLGALTGSRTGAWRAAVTTCSTQPWPHYRSTRSQPAGGSSTGLASTGRSGTPTANHPANSGATSHHRYGNEPLRPAAAYGGPQHPRAVSSDAPRVRGHRPRPPYLAAAALVAIHRLAMPLPQGATERCSTRSRCSTRHSSSPTGLEPICNAGQTYGGGALPRRLLARARRQVASWRHRLEHGDDRALRPDDLAPRFCSFRPSARTPSASNPRSAAAPPPDSAKAPRHRHVPPRQLVPPRPAPAGPDLSDRDSSVMRRSSSHAPSHFLV
jgi:hypothetical protein